MHNRILKRDKGDRTFFDQMAMARDLDNAGLDTLEVACDLTLQAGIISDA